MSGCNYVVVVCDTCHFVLQVLLVQIAHVAISQRRCIAVAGPPPVSPSSPNFALRRGVPIWPVAGRDSGANCDKCTSVSGVDASHLGGFGQLYEKTAYDVKSALLLKKKY